MADDLRERVKEERKLRSLSIRSASKLGDCSNTIWGDWESGKTAEVGDKLRAAGVKAFSWEPDWPENPPPSRIKPDETDDPGNGALLEALEWMAEVVEDTNAMLRLMAKRQGVRLPAPARRAPSPRALNAGRRKDDRL